MKAFLCPQIFGRSFVQQQRFTFALAGTDPIALTIPIAYLWFGMNTAIVYRITWNLQKHAVLQIEWNTTNQLETNI